MTTAPSTPAPKNRIGLGLNRPRPSHLNTPFANTSYSNGNSSSGLPHPSSSVQRPTSPLLSPSTMLARKASLNQLTQNSLASIPDGSMGYGLGSPTRSRNGDDGRHHRGRATPIAGDVDVGDQVNTPGGMHGTVKFIGVVKGKAGVFVGVELDHDMAGRGKNDGAVDGVRYFTTAHPNSGIFVPLTRATKRNSASSSNPPPTPTLLNVNLPSPTGILALPTFPTPRRSESPFGFAGRNGIGLAPNSRPSLPRSESPIRRTTPGPPPGRHGLVPPQAPRNVSSAMGGRFGAPSPGPSKINYGRPRASSIASTNGGGHIAIGNAPERPGTSGGTPGGTPRYSHTPKHSGGPLSIKQPKNTGMSNLRSGSSLGMRSISSLDRHTEDPHETSPIDSGIGLNRSDRDEYETSALERTLAERDHQLQEQAAQLLEMEASFSELQSLVQSAQLPSLSSPVSRGGFEDVDASQLRGILREKNDKIQILTAEFDSHRADFRSTIDTLELASTETERVYEKRVEELLGEIRELQDRNEDVESVARQLKQLEELVAELEEGLEDARRGEAEARGEVEFLRGEVERCREELRREREKSAAAVANAAVGRMRSGDGEVEKKDDEIRGLKAIIHSLSRDAVTDGHEGHRRGVDGEELEMERNTREGLEQEVRELQGLIERKAGREEELEKEIEALRKRRETRGGGSISGERPVAGSWGRGSGERQRSIVTMGENDTATGGGRDSRGTISSWRRNRPSSAASQNGLMGVDDTVAVGSGGLTPITAEGSEAGSVLWCEICETAGHDILTCTSMFGSAAGGPASAGPQGEKKPQKEEEGEEEEHEVEHEDDHDDDADSIASVGEAVEATIATVNGLGTAQGDRGGAVSVIGERRKSVHLPAPPPMVSESSFGPVAGKENGVVDMERWCALCERDGHDSVDCPLDIDF